MKKIKILLDSNRKDNYKNGLKISTYNCAVVVLLQTDNNQNILFDTGAFGYADKLVESLRVEGLKPEDIDYVFLSHSHFDHFANCYLFTNAKLIYDKWIVNISNGDTVKYGKKYKFIPKVDIKEIEIIRTQGHTSDSLSILCNYQGKKYAIVGDAVKASLIKDGIIAGYDNPGDYLENMKKLFNLADVIIAGDDGEISGNKFNELKKMISSLEID